VSTIQVFPVYADDHPVMPNLYFCQPHARNQGTLRAVITMTDFQLLVASAPAVYVGEDFPKVFEAEGPTLDFAVVGVSASEASAQWKSGYYRVEADLMELNAQLLTLVR
jgi:hypothetical protein